MNGLIEQQRNKQLFINASRQVDPAEVMAAGINAARNIEASEYMLIDAMIEELIAIRQSKFGQTDDGWLSRSHTIEVDQAWEAYTA